MSQRTIIEVNHDIARVVPGDVAMFTRLWNAAIGSGSKESWEPLERRWGIRRVVQCHHSADRKAMVGSQEYQIG